MQSAEFSPAGTATPQVGFQAFDPSLGTLNRAVLEFFGTLTVSLPTPPFINSESLLPVPYGFTAVVTQSFAGLGALSPFGFSAPARFEVRDVMANGAGELVTLVLPFSYTMDFTETSNTTGQVIPSFTGATTPPQSVSGTLAMFIADAGASSLLIQALNAVPLIPLTDFELGTIIGTVAMAGGALLTFDYTAAVTPPRPTPQPIPEPPVPWLVAAAVVAGLAATRRRAARG